MAPPPERISKRQRTDEDRPRPASTAVLFGPPPKACKLCHKAKVKCDRRRPVCSRCTARREQCEYLDEGSEQETVARRTGYGLGPPLVPSPQTAHTATETRLPAPPQKACNNCFVSKVKCDHRIPQCTRCAIRRTACIYGREDESSANQGTVQETSQDYLAPPVASPITRPASPPTNYELPFEVSREDESSMNQSPLPEAPEQIYYAPPIVPPIPLPANNAPSPSRRPQNQCPSATPQIDPIFKETLLYCPLDCDQIRDRWLGTFAPRPGQVPKNIAPGTARMMLAVLRSYPGMLTLPKGLPPFVHASQRLCEQRDLAGCACIAVMWEKQSPGNREQVRELIMSEMQKLFAKRGHMTRFEELCAFQAYVLYALMLLPESHGSGPALDATVVFNLQEFACSFAQSGLVCPAEQTSTRPDWESWVIAEAKRRTLYVMYMLDDVVNTLSGTICVLGEELSVLPLTCSETLWHAASKEVWQKAYNRYLGADDFLYMKDLWRMADATSSKKMDQWLASTDKLGLMIHTIATVTHTR